MTFLWCLWGRIAFGVGRRGDRGSFEIANLILVPGISGGDG